MRFPTLVFVLSGLALLGCGGSTTSDGASTGGKAGSAGGGAGGSSGSGGSGAGGSGGVAGSGGIAGSAGVFLGGYLADALGESQPKISRHLAYLRGTGLVSTRRDGKWVYYGIDDGLDRDVRRVLDTTLSSIRYSNPIANAEASGYSDSAQTREVEVDDWSPNEMAIHLL